MRIKKRISIPVSHGMPSIYSSPNRPEWLAWAMELITHHEGIRRIVYDDGLGNPTIGIGFNLNRNDAAKLLNELGLNFHSVMSGGTELTGRQVQYLLSYTVNEAVDIARNWLGESFDKLNPARKAAIVDFAFNLGAGTLKQFRGTKKEIQNENWEEVAKHLENSLWYKQVGRRGRNLVKIFKEGKIREIE